MRRERTPFVVRYLVPAPGMNTISYSWLNDSNAEEAIRAEVSFLRPLGQPFEWIVGEHDPFPGLKDHLEAQGFTPTEPASLLALDVAEAPPALLAPLKADVRRLTSPEELAGVVSVEEQVWGGDFSWLARRLEAHLKVPGYVHVYAAYLEGEPVATAWIYFHRNTQFAGLFGGSTLPAFRRQGLYTALLARRVQDARQAGTRFLTISPTSMSQPVVSKYGFRLLGMLQDFKQSSSLLKKSEE